MGRPHSTIPARVIPGAVNYIRAEVSFNTPNAGKIWIGTLPKGAVLLQSLGKCTQGFNGGTNVVAVGTNPAVDNIISSPDLAEGTPGANFIGTGALLEFSEDTPVYLRYTQTGTVATAGRVIVIVPYVCD
jgi:hypothetical protein